MIPLFETGGIRIHAGESIAIVGRSASGKTTFARCLAGMPTHQQHDIHWTAPLTVLQRQYVHQDPVRALSPYLTVREILSEASTANPRLRVVANPEIFSLISDLIERPTARTLSGGQSARLALARALYALSLCVEPRLLILDETFAALDDETRQQSLETLASLQSQLKFSQIHITHNWALASSGRILMMHEGRLIDDLNHSAAIELREAALPD